MSKLRMSFTKNKDKSATFITKVDNLDDIAMNTIFPEIIKRVTELWVEEYGYELISSIAPEKVEEVLKQEIAKRLLK